MTRLIIAVALAAALLSACARPTDNWHAISRLTGHIAGQ